jgi:hypothetical protein
VPTLVTVGSSYAVVGPPRRCQLRGYKPPARSRGGPASSYQPDRTSTSRWSSSHLASTTFWHVLAFRALRGSPHPFPDARAGMDAGLAGAHAGLSRAAASRVIWREAVTQQRRVLLDRNSGLGRGNRGHVWLSLVTGRCLLSSVNLTAGRVQLHPIRLVNWFMSK